MTTFNPESPTNPNNNSIQVQLPNLVLIGRPTNPRRVIPPLPDITWQLQVLSHRQPQDSDRPSTETSSIKQEVTSKTLSPKEQPTNDKSAPSNSDVSSSKLVAVILESLRPANWSKPTPRSSPVKPGNETGKPQPPPDSTIHPNSDNSELKPWSVVHMAETLCRLCVRRRARRSDNHFQVLRLEEYNLAVHDSLTFEEATLTFEHSDNVCVMKDWHCTDFPSDRNSHPIHDIADENVEFCLTGKNTPHPPRPRYDSEI